MSAHATVSLEKNSLGMLMPMHVSLSREGMIVTAGPTIERIANRPLVGTAFDEVFILRRPAKSQRSRDLAQLAGQPLQIALNVVPPILLRGVAAPAAQGGLLVNLSLGINLAEIVKLHRLNQAHFAATDFAVEMLYLLEVKSLVMNELRGLTSRLQAARTIAEKQAQTDPLTGLFNRRAMETRLASLCNGSLPFGVLHLDLDYFKQVNDTLGHAAGDRALQVVATILTAETRQTDLVARVGGDEFVILLPNLANIPAMENIAQRIIRRLDQPIPFQNDSCRISASVGMVVSSHYEHPRPDRLMYDADEALYASKHAGRGRATNFATLRASHPP